MTVPTPPAFAAMKAIAWVDRHTARDLYDLTGLVRIGALDDEARSLFQAHMGWSLAPHVFEGLPPLDWEAQLSHLRVVKTTIVD